MVARYIPLIEAGPERQMAIDEAILRNFDQGNSDPTFRFFRFKPSAITLGYSQPVKKTIDIETCEDYDIPYVRRITGGGTVFHDYDGEITYSVVTEKIEGDIEESFRKLLGPIMDTLEEFDLEPKFKPYNDVLVNKKKISGSAQRRGKKGLLQHGTLMFATDLKKLAEILKIDDKKFEEKGADSFLDLVTTIEKETGDVPEPEKLIELMKEKYEDYFGEKIKKEKLTKEEIELADELEEKYGSERWLNERKWG
ncbi:MAG: lipoate--protein ligase family protein [Candidatus Thermoplasmatota archaeon]|nr:lipoate--protein ligase family protein [Candidatus Thermoplasmatota archaeon]MBS3789878.1 lipoate--protein ligase family protein [Candidatus Thermoplasmatota archaeon]